MIKLRNYELEGNIFGDEVNVLETLVTDYAGTTYICDAISEVADNAVPVYSCELFKCCAELDEWVCEAQEEGLLGTKFTGLENILRVGAYTYYERTLYNNLDTIIFNYAVEYIKDNYEKDRKSTRLNSSHANISYAVFCLKKKKTTIP